MPGGLCVICEPADLASTSNRSLSRSQYPHHVGQSLKVNDQFISKWPVSPTPSDFSHSHDTHTTEDVRSGSREATFDSLSPRYQLLLVGAAVGEQPERPFFAVRSRTWGQYVHNLYGSGQLFLLTNFSLAYAYSSVNHAEHISCKPRGVPHFVHTWDLPPISYVCTCLWGVPSNGGGD